MRRSDADREMMPMLFLILLCLFCLLALVPLWVFLVPLAGLTVGGFCLRKRPRARIACLVLGVPLVLVAIPALLSVGSKARVLQACFGPMHGPRRIVRYRHNLVAFEDHKYYWKLTDVDRRDCDRIIQEYQLERADVDHLFSRMSPPTWWPTSTDGYSIFAGDDGHLGTREMWVAREGASAYLFKFDE